MQTEDTKEIFCNRCLSADVEYLFQCPACYVEDFDRVKLIEHYNCGNISPEFEYTNNLCPNCDEEIKHLDVDYKIIHNMFICSSCLEKFPEPILNIKCRKCQNLFKLKDTKSNLGN